MRILGLDLGSKRIGLSISDETSILASGLGILERKSLTEDLAYLQRLVAESHIEKIVIGSPLNMNGSSGPKAQEALAFKAELEQVLRIPIELFDERLTTAEAERVLIEAGMTRKKRRGLVDQQAAVLILQGYLDRQRRKSL